MKRFIRFYERKCWNLKKIYRYLLPLLLCFLFAPNGFALTETDLAHDGYVLRFKDAESAALAKELIAARSTYSSEESEMLILNTVSDKLDMYTTDNKELVLALEQAGLLKYSEPNIYAKLFTDTETQPDTDTGSETAPEAPEEPVVKPIIGYDYSTDVRYADQWAHRATHVTDAWAYGVYGNDVVVAVIDSGVFADHADLKNGLLPGIFIENGVYDPAKNGVNDTIGHGTSVAGVICSGANGIGVVGTAHRSKVLPIKATDSKGKIPIANIAAAILAACDNGADVINMSFGYSYGDNLVNDHSSVYDAISYALMENVILVAAAGNEGNSVYQYPASFDGVISVANLCRVNDTEFGIYSSSTHNDKVMIAAPGTSVCTASKDGSYSYRNGTSFSSPYIAGVAALAKSVDPDITPEHFIELLTQTADKTPLAGEERNDKFGYGIVNAGALIQTLIAEKARGGFLSPVDIREDGKGNLCVWNPLAVESTLNLITKTGAFRLVCAGVEQITLKPNEVKEISLTKTAGIENGIQCYLLDAFSFRPMCMVRTARMAL